MLGVDVHSCVMSALLLAVDNQRYHLSAVFLNLNNQTSGLTVTAQRNTHLSCTPVFQYNYGQIWFMIFACVVVLGKIKRLVP